MDIRQFFFKYRSFTPIPLALMIIAFAHPQKELVLIGILFLALGEMIRIWAVSHAGGATRTRNVGAPFLCTTGPYSRVRNPLYIGNILIFIAIVLIAGTPSLWTMLAVTVTFFIIQYSLIISLEEETLIEIFGDAYDTYRKNVPALMPKISAFKTSETRGRASLRKTLITEKRTLQNIFLILVLITLRVNFF